MAVSLQKTGAWLRRRAENVAAGLLAVMFAAFILQIAFRYFFNFPIGWTSELSKFGAHAFQSDPHRVVTFGGKPLVGAEVESPYIIRVAIALLMLAASIDGRSRILNATPIRRAHPRFVENLVSLGARIEWVEGR